MRSAIRLVAIVVGIQTCGACATTGASGSIILEANCPGDVNLAKKPAGPPDGDESAFAAALLTPIITGVISQGIKVAGSKLKESAQEKSIDVLNQGGYFYSWQTHLPSEDDKKVPVNSGFRPSSSCIIIASRSTLKTKRSLDEIVSGYKFKRVIWEEDTSRSVMVPSQDSAWEADGQSKADLKLLLTNRGFTDERKPGVLAIFDVEVSNRHKEGRLVPRYVYMDHSVREKSDDSYLRTISYEMSFSTPAATEKFANLFVKFEGLAVNSPLGPEELKSPVLGGSTGIKSNWFAFPAVDAATVTLQTAHKDAKLKASSSQTGAVLAAYAAKELGTSDLFYLDFVVDYENASGNSPWPSAKSLREKLPIVNANLAVEQAKPKDRIDPQKVALHVQEKTFIEGALEYLASAKKVVENALDDGDVARTFDMSVDIKEFRKRPIAEFFGDVLSQEAVQTGIVSALDAQFNPATRKATSDAEAAKALEVQTALEDTIVAAHTAQATYENPASAAEKATAYVSMEAARRKANRLADQLGVPLPFPGSGVWLGL